MTKVKLLFSLVLAVLLVTAGCKKKDLTPDVPPINVIVKARYDTTGGNFNFPLTGISIKLTNQLSGAVLQQQTDNAGLAIFNSVSAGNYSVEATFKLHRNEFTAITGEETEQDSVTFNASLNNRTLNSASNNTLELNLATGTIGDWVIKQIYYAGSHTKNGAAFRDQFIEIYNNSNKVLYADSLYFAQVMGNNTSAATTDLGKGYYITDAGDPLYKQFDWSKSPNMPAGAGIGATHNYIYAKSLFRVPGSGTQHPVQPGESFVIAATAINHKAPYVDSAGEAVNILNPELTIDLNGADFEVNVRNFVPNPLASDVDNLAVPNLINLTSYVRDLILDNLGRDAFVIFKTTTHIPAIDPTQTTTWGAFISPDDGTTSGGDKKYYYQVPRQVVIDAVEIARTEASTRNPKRLMPSLDAGITYVPGGSYSSQSVIRKTFKVVGGRKILHDTNNSSNDFDYLQKAEPKAFK